MKNLFIFLMLTLATQAQSQESFQSLCGMAQKEVDAQNYEKAVEFYDKALTLKTDDATKMRWTALLASVCASHLNDEQLMLKYNNIAIDCGSTDVFMLDQQLELAEKYKDLNTTEKTLNAARNLDGKYKKYSLMLMYFYYKNKKYAETEATADEILVIDSDNVNAMTYKGLALIQTGNNEKAIENFESVLNISPNNLNANIQTGMILYNKAKTLFDSANKNYENIKSPTALQYHQYKKEIVKSKPYYEQCLPYLKKYNSVKSQKNITNAISEAESRINDLENL
uniref:tetratricopeptide repeat protein n=1 Tax=uncultured Draconibacterium sp. TaxID=1573823 RepID=UPI003217CC4C